MLLESEQRRGEYHGQVETFHLKVARGKSLNLYKCYLLIYSNHVLSCLGSRQIV